MSNDAFDPDEYPAVAVLCPELPPYPQLDASSAGDDAARASDDLAEAAALAYLCVFKPHGAEKDMRGEFVSWTSALREAKLNPALWADASNEQKRAEWDADKKQVERHRDILPVCDCSSRSYSTSKK